MNVSFLPLRPDAAHFLTVATGVDFRHVDFNDAEEWFSCTARNEFGEVQLVIAVEFKTWFDGHVSTAVRHPRALSRRLLTACFRALFSRARRLTALIEPNNEPALRQVTRMGFRHEGYLRFGIGGTRDALLFGLVAEDCPYLLGVPFRMRTLQITHDMPDARM